MADALRERPLTRPLLLMVTALFGLAGFGHVGQLDPWVMGFFYGALALRLLVWRRVGQVPGRAWLLPLALVGVALALWRAGLSEGRMFGVALLVAMLGLKLLEVRTRRDLYVAVFLGYFLLSTLFLFDQSPAITAWVLLLVVGLTALLNLINRSGTQPLPALRTAGLMLLAAAPVALLLFVLFPRLGGPLWSFRVGAPEGITGMSDRLEMGTIGALSLSDEIAFRVRFDGTPPLPDQLYWRGMTLVQTDGKRWTRGPRQLPGKLRLGTEGEPLRYEVVMEPSKQPWLFPLDRPVEMPKDSVLSIDMEGFLRHPILERRRLAFTSTTRYIDRQLTASQRQHALEIPTDVITPRLRTLVQQWRRDASDQQVVEAALRHFHEQEFVYTLEPPLLGSSPVDEFMFETRQGFCEHYASAFVTLMRIAGIPARIVVGYLGGQINPVGGHMVVYQADAHAWAEVWQETTGWVRVDPTAAVAPERIRAGIRAERRGMGEPVRFDLGQLGWLGGALRDLAWLRDTMELQWQYWVVEFNRSRQQDLLGRWGLGWLKGQRLGIAAVVIASAVTGAVFLLLFWRGRRETDPLRALYLRLLGKLRKAGLATPAWQTPDGLREMAAAHFPVQAAQLRQLFGHYVALRYAGLTDHSRLRQLRQGIRRLKLTYYRRGSGSTGP